jgi:hypothetical protein
MSFSASTCLSNTGTATLGPTLNIYSNPESPTSPGTYVTNVPTEDITGGNCPYTLELPDGTTSIRISDPVSGCYCDVPIDDNNMCTTCDLAFDYYSPVSVGNIVAGDITGTCDASVSNYLINWYDVSDPLNPVFYLSSGKGSMFTPYDKVHPLTGITSVLAPSGTYDARLEKIELNGVVFSRTGGTGTVLADLDCLPSLVSDNPIIVSALNCNNGGGSSNLAQYEHRFAYDAGTGGKTPEPLSTTFELSAGTQYFPWSFQGVNVPDKIKFTLVGSAYNDQPIILDYWEVGDLPDSNSTPTKYPKSADTTNFFSKIISLTAFTINEGDNVLIEVSPSTANTQTSWTLYCGCLNETNCFNCVPPTATNYTGGTSYQYRISASTITAYALDACGTYRYGYYNKNECPYSAWTGSTEYLYMNGSGISQSPVSSNNIDLWFTRESCSQSGYGNTPTCLNYGSGTNITYEKTVGLFTLTSNNPSVISTQYNNYLNVRSSWITPNSGTSSNIEYYRYMQLTWPTTTGTTPCGDGTGTKSSYFHVSSIVTTGQTGSDYYMSLTQPTIVSGMSFTSCQIYCNSYISSIVNEVNTAATGTTSNYLGTSTVGSIYNTLFSSTLVLSFNNEIRTSGVTSNAYSLSRTSNFTYPGSGVTTTLIPSLTGETCSTINNNMFVNGNVGYYKYLTRYLTKLTNPSDPLDFEIYAYPIDITGQITNPFSSGLKLIFTRVGGIDTIIDPDYFV